jgi:hypothetical protein
VLEYGISRERIRSLWRPKYFFSPLHRFVAFASSGISNLHALPRTWSTSCPTSEAETMRVGLGYPEPPVVIPPLPIITGGNGHGRVNPELPYPFRSHAPLTFSAPRFDLGDAADNAHPWTFVSVRTAAKRSRPERPASRLRCDLCRWKCDRLREYLETNVDVYPTHTCPLGALSISISSIV